MLMITQSVYLITSADQSAEEDPHQLILVEEVLIDKSRDRSLGKYFRHSSIRLVFVCLTYVEEGY